MKPLVGILCTTEYIKFPGTRSLPHQAVFQKYVDAVAKYSNCLPILIPVEWAGLDFIDKLSLQIVKKLNGVLLPGGASNIAVELYSDTLQHVGARDFMRDKFALSIIHAAKTTGTPLLGICRGMQEINIACGGSLIPSLNGVLDHKANINMPFEERYKPRHKLCLAENSWINDALSTGQLINFDIYVNSLHGQGIGRLGEELSVDAFSEDGNIEAISHTRKEVNIFGVQWHPEWYTEQCKTSMFVWQKFGESCQKHLIDN